MTAYKFMDICFDTQAEESISELKGEKNRRLQLPKILLKIK